MILYLTTTFVTHGHYERAAHEDFASSILELIFILRTFNEIWTRPEDLLMAIYVINAIQAAEIMSMQWFPYNLFVANLGIKVTKRFLNNCYLFLVLTVTSIALKKQRMPICIVLAGKISFINQQRIDRVASSVCSNFSGQRDFGACCWGNHASIISRLPPSLASLHAAPLLAWLSQAKVLLASQCKSVLNCIEIDWFRAELVAL